MLSNVFTELQLARLKEHKYSVSGSSFMEPVLQVYWRWLVTKMPLWLAPNLITLLGLLLNVATTVVLLVLDPQALGKAPQWSYLLFVAGLFIYQSLDAVDGKQARRTQSATPLGELFDHGCDALSALMMGIACGSAASLGEFHFFYPVICLIVLALFYCSHWQAFVCGKLTFRWLDVTEAQFFIMFIHIVPGFFGTAFWKQEFLFGLELRIIIISGCMVVLVWTLLQDFVDILRGGIGKNGSTCADTSVLSPGLPLAVSCYFTWSYVKHSDVVYRQFPCLALLTLGLPIVKLTWLIVVAHMTRTPMPLYDSSLLGPLALWLNNHFGGKVIDEQIVFILVLIFLLVNLYSHAHIGCKQICMYFDISCFTIPYPPPTSPPKDATSSEKSNGNETAQRTEGIPTSRIKGNT